MCNWKESARIQWSGKHQTTQLAASSTVQVASSTDEIMTFVDYLTVMNYEKYSCIRGKQRLGESIFTWSNVCVCELNKDWVRVYSPEVVYVR